MSATHDIEHLIAAIRADDSLRDQVERAILSDRLLGLPDQLAELTRVVEKQGERLDALTLVVEKQGERLDALTRVVEKQGERIDALERTVGELAHAVEELVVVSRLHGERLDEVDRSVAWLKGLNLEAKFARNPGYWVHGLVRRARVVSLDQVLEDLGLVDELDDDEYGLLSRADFFVRGVDRRTRERLLLVVETTWKPHQDDVGRQAARRDALRGRGVGATPVIVSVEEPSAAVRQAIDNAEILLTVSSAAAAA
jgi:uncharacterized coiled-coil protein SlyX